MLAAFWFLASDPAEEGRNVILSMLVVGLVFVAVIAIGELAHYATAKRKASKPSRTL
jgi:hypothetical protein